MQGNSGITEVPSRENARCTWARGSLRLPIRQRGFPLGVLTQKFDHSMLEAMDAAILVILRDDRSTEYALFIEVSIRVLLENPATKQKNN